MTTGSETLLQQAFMLIIHNINYLNPMFLNQRLYLVVTCDAISISDCSSILFERLDQEPTINCRVRRPTFLSIIPPIAPPVLQNIFYSLPAYATCLLLSLSTYISLRLLFLTYALLLTLLTRYSAAKKSHQATGHCQCLFFVEPNNYMYILSARAVLLATNNLDSSCPFDTLDPNILWQR